MDLIKLKKGREIQEKLDHLYFVLELATNQGIQNKIIIISFLSDEIRKLEDEFFKL